MQALFCFHRLFPWLWRHDPVVKALEAQRRETDAKLTREKAGLDVELRLFAEMLHGDLPAKKELPRHER